MSSLEVKSKYLILDSTRHSVFASAHQRLRDVKSGCVHYALVRVAKSFLEPIVGELRQKRFQPVSGDLDVVVS